MVMNKSRMFKTLKTLYPDDFMERRPKKKRQGFIKRRVNRRWNSLTSFFRRLGRAKLVTGSFAITFAISGVYTAYVYNKFTTYTNDILTAEANVDKEIQRRNDLINNLIPPTLNYSLYEKEMFSHVAELRKEFTSLGDILKEKMGDKSMLLGLGDIKAQLPSLFGIFENYPDLKASLPFSDLMKELIETENRIALTRETFNGVVNVFNVYFDRIPAAWIGRMLGYKKESWFGANDNAALVPDMKMLDPVIGK